MLTKAKQFLRRLFNANQKNDLILLNYLKKNMYPSHSNQSSSLQLELIEQFLYEGKIGCKSIEIQLWDAKMSVMRVRSRLPATSKIELFVTIAKGWKPSKIVTKSSILQSFTKHLRLTLAFMWNSALREKFQVSISVSQEFFI